MFIIDKILNRTECFPIDVYCKNQDQANTILDMISRQRYVACYNHTEKPCCEGLSMHVDITAWGNGHRDQIFKKIIEIYSYSE